MNPTSPTAFHSVEEEWLASYSAGGLSPAKRLLIECQSTLKPALSDRLAAMDNVGGALLESARGEVLSENFLDRMIGKLDDLPVPAEAASGDIAAKNGGPRKSWIPSPLEDYLQRSGNKLQWKSLGFGVERASLANDNGEELYLLKAKPGLKIPQHSHEGEEWALILQGGYHVGETGYVRGDLHRENDTCTHMPVIDDDKEACITLVAIEGSLRFSNPIMRMIKPVIGI